MMMTTDYTVYLRYARSLTFHCVTMHGLNPCCNQILVTEIGGETVYVREKKYAHLRIII